MSYATYHQLKAPDPSVSLEGLGYGSHNTEFVGTENNPATPLPTIKAGGYAGYHQGYLPNDANVLELTNFGNPNQVGTMIPVSYTHLTLPTKA